MDLQGVWLPIITPFTGGRIDFKSYERLLRHYLTTDIKGLIPLGTTGESPVVSLEESTEIIKKTVGIVDGRCPVFAGVGGNDTAQVAARVKQVASLGVDGILSPCPSYNRPGQEGLYRHFKAIAEASDLKIILYNIPYRTGVNMSNETVFRLAEIETIIGIKDSCGDIYQSLALLADKPNGFSVLTGEDALFFTTLANGGDGGILASAHLQTDLFTDVFSRIMANDHTGARAVWQKMNQQIPLLFAEANPGPIKYCLEQKKLIDSGEMRLPMTSISEELKAKLDMVI